MLKHVMKLLLVLALLGVATAQAAPPAQAAGKVVAVEDGKVKISVAGEKPAWFKANTPVKFPEGVGKILEVSGDVATIRTKLSSKLKAGDAVSFEKGKSMQGC
jgi:co-chaperonin GroES (HSP10)